MINQVTTIQDEPFQQAAALRHPRQKKKATARGHSVDHHARARGDNERRGRGATHLQTREQLRRSTQSSCENTRAITCAGARSAAAESPPAPPACSSPCRGGAMADPPARPPPPLVLEWTSGLQKPRSILLVPPRLKNWRRRFLLGLVTPRIQTRFVDEGRRDKNAI